MMQSPPLRLRRCRPDPLVLSRLLDQLLQWDPRDLLVLRYQLRRLALWGLPNPECLPGQVARFLRLILQDPLIREDLECLLSHPSIAGRWKWRSGLG